MYCCMTVLVTPWSRCHLPRLGHKSESSGDLHPFLSHYQSCGTRGHRHMPPTRSYPPPHGQCMLPPHRHTRLYVLPNRLSTSHPPRHIGLHNTHPQDSLQLWHPSRPRQNQSTQPLNRQRPRRHPMLRDIVCVVIKLAPAGGAAASAPEGVRL
jgi:hypothetical protein